MSANKSAYILLKRHPLFSYDNEKKCELAELIFSRVDRRRIEGIAPYTAQHNAMTSM